MQNNITYQIIHDNQKLLCFVGIGDISKTLYSCLKNQINSVGVGNMSSNEQLAFSLLALGYDSTMKGKIRDQESFGIK